MRRRLRDRRNGYGGHFANVTNIEGLVLNAGGSDVTLTNSLVAGTNTGFF